MFKAPHWERASLASSPRIPFLPESQHFAFHGTLPVLLLLVSLAPCSRASLGQGYCARTPTPSLPESSVNPSCSLQRIVQNLSVNPPFFIQASLAAINDHVLIQLAFVLSVFMYRMSYSYLYPQGLSWSLKGPQWVNGFSFEM